MTDFTSNNVHTFPGRTTNPNVTIGDAPLTEAEVENTMDLIKHIHVARTLETVMPIFFESLGYAGFGVTDDEQMDILFNAFLIEVVRAMCCRRYKLEHPFHKLATELFKYDEKDGSLRMNKEVIVDFKGDDSDA